MVRHPLGEDRVGISAWDSVLDCAALAVLADQVVAKVNTPDGLAALKLAGAMKMKRQQ